MSIIRKLLSIIPLVLLSTGVNAGGRVESNNIDSVAFQTGGFFLYSDDGWSNPNPCSQNNAIVLLSSDANYDKAYALLLAAYMAGKHVSGYSDGCVEFDGKTYSTIRGSKYLVVK